MFSVSVCAPAYNEEEGIEDVLKSWVKSLELGMEVGIFTDYEIVICDDGSKDRTISTIDKIGNNRIKVVKNSDNQGSGIAIRRAIQASSNQFVITIDSDGQFKLEEALEWIKGVDKNTIVLGYRKKEGSLPHKIGSKLSNALFGLSFSEKIPDANCMLKLLPGDLARRLDMRAVGLNYSGEMTFLICTSQSKVIWKPVSHLERSTGKSSVRLARDGVNRIRFQFFLLFEHYLIKKKILSARNGL